MFDFVVFPVYARTAVPVVMTVCSEAGVWVHALNKRQLVQQEHESLTRTAWQNAAELYHLQACSI